MGGSESTEKKLVESTGRGCAEPELDQVLVGLAVSRGNYRPGTPQHHSQINNTVNVILQTNVVPQPHNVVKGKPSNMASLPQGSTRALKNPVNPKKQCQERSCQKKRGKQETLQCINPVEKMITYEFSCPKCKTLWLSSAKSAKKGRECHNCKTLVFPKEKTFLKMN